MMLKEITEDGIKKLVYQFYDKIRDDAELGPVFNQAIAAEDWPAHLNTMCDFWSSTMLKTGRYHGSPPRKHMDLPRFHSDLFDRWLKLFAETVNEIFEPLPAREFQDMSQIIARGLKYMLYGKP